LSYLKWASQLSELALPFGSLSVFIGRFSFGHVSLLFSFETRNSFRKILWDRLVGSLKHFSELLRTLVSDQTSDIDADDVKEGLDVEKIGSLSLK